jgi:hypothetical protein
VALFFLSCVAVAEIYGALTASKKIFFIQALPALIAIELGEKYGIRTVVILPSAMIGSDAYKLSYSNNLVYQILNG